MSDAEGPQNGIAQPGQETPSPFPYWRWPRDYENPYGWRHSVSTWSSRLIEISSHLNAALASKDEAKVSQLESEYKEAKEQLSKFSSDSNRAMSSPDIVAAQLLATQVILAQVLTNIKDLSPELSQSISSEISQAADELRSVQQQGVGIAKEAEAIVSVFAEAFRATKP